MTQELEHRIRDLKRLQATIITLVDVGTRYPEMVNLDVIPRMMRRAANEWDRRAEGCDCSCHMPGWLNQENDCCPCKPGWNPEDHQ